MIKQSILLVDDHRENLIALEAVLEAPGRRLVMATSGEEALGLALKQDFALILLDVQMPDMDGFEVAELLRKTRRTSQIPIIFVTAISKEQKYIFRGYECGAVDYIFKPVDSRILDAKVKVFLELDLQRKKLQQAVVQMKRRKDENDRLLQALGAGVVGTDKDGRITFCNDAACALLNLEKTQLVGSDVDGLLLLDQEGRPRWSWSDSPVRADCAKGQTWMNQQLLYARSGEGCLAIELTANPINRQEDAFSGTVMLFRDVGSHDLLSAEVVAREHRQFRRKKVYREMVLFDRKTGANVGRMLNLSTDGFKLLIRQNVELGKSYAFSMVLPEQIKGVNTMSFDARAVWMQPGDTPGETHAGFQFLDLTESAGEILEVLLEKC